MHKRSIFSSRFNQERHETNDQWLRAFKESKLFPKLSELASVKKVTATKAVTVNKPIRHRLLTDNEWYNSDKISITDRYLMEQKLNIDLLEKFERESIVLFVTKEEIPEEGPPRRKVRKALTKTEKIKILEDVLKIEVLEETLHELNIKKIMDPSMQHLTTTSYPVTSSDGKYVCFYCDKRFNRSWILSNHMKLHNGVRPFPCPQCPHVFADLSNLRSHQRSKGHHDWKFACTQCSKPFHMPQLLDRHTIHACRRYLTKSKKLM